MGRTACTEPQYIYKGVLYLHLFEIKMSCQHHTPAALYTERTRYVLNLMLGGSQVRSGRFLEKRKMCFT
jgi:hypothetical protein